MVRKFSCESEKRDAVLEQLIVAGLDKAGQQIITQRWNICCKHIKRWLVLLALWDAGLLDPSRRAELAQRIAACRRIVTAADSTDYAVLENGWHRWEREFLLPLARELDIWHQAYQRTWNQDFERCWKRGLFDRPRSTHKPLQYKRPGYQVCRDQIQQIFKEHSSRNARVTALVSQGLCADEAVAISAVQHLEDTDRTAVHHTWDVLWSAVADSPIYLLLHAGYQCADEIVFVQRYAGVLERMAEHPEELMSLLRTSVIGLYRALTSQAVVQTLFRHKEIPIDILARPSEALGKRERVQYQKALKFVATGLWRQDLLHRPKHDPARTAYVEQITPELRAAIISGLARECNCDAAHAEALFEAFADAGLPGLVNLLCQVPVGRTTETFTIYRIREALDRHVGWLIGPDRREIERLLICLQETVEVLEVPIPLFPLVDTYPGNDCRKQFKHWLKTEPRIIATFAERAGLRSDDSSARLYAFGTYGALGLLRLRQEHLYKILPPFLVRYLHFLKLAHADNHLDLTLVRSRVNDIGATIGTPELSPQIIRALFGRLKKEPHWNSGVGASTDAFRVRPSPYLPGIPRLFRAFVLVPVKLGIPVVDQVTSQADECCYAVLALDHDSALPMGCWVSPRRPGAIEVALGLYQAIWHIGSVWWPLRGVPDSILLPMKSLDLGVEHLRNLERAAHFMLSRIEPNNREAHWRKQRLVRQFCEELPFAVRKNLAGGYVTCGQVQSTALEWLYHTRLRREHSREFSRIDTRTEGYGDQKEAADAGDRLSSLRLSDLDEMDGVRLNTQRTSRVDSTWGSQGFAVPGYDTPAAGWLLPEAADKAEATSDGILLRGNNYTNPHIQIPPGTEVTYRQFPVSRATVERGVFVDYQGYLYYFTRSIGRY